MDAVTRLQVSATCAKMVEFYYKKRANIQTERKISVEMFVNVLIWKNVVKFV